MHPLSGTVCRRDMRVEEGERENGPHGLRQTFRGLSFHYERFGSIED